MPPRDKNPFTSRSSSNDAPNQNHVRLQRVMADAGVASRRDCEQMITQGLVEVNGERVDHLPVFVDPLNDRIVVDGRALKPLRKGAQSSSDGRGVLPGRTYVMLHKPDRVLCTTSDDATDRSGVSLGGGRTTVSELVQHPSGARLYPVGRLEYHSTGLVLMTNDGALADRLTHARYGVTRTYRVTIKGHASSELVRDLRRRVAADEAAPEPPPVAGRIVRGRRVGPDTSELAPKDSVRIVRTPVAAGADSQVLASANTVIEITLREGKSRQLRAILEQMGALTRKLTRVGIGPLRLRGVALGQWRDLTRDEVAMLMQAGGLSDTPLPRPRPRPPEKRAPARTVVRTGDRYTPREKPAPNSRGNSRDTPRDKPRDNPRNSTRENPRASSSANTRFNPRAKPGNRPSSKPTGKPSRSPGTDRGDRRR